MECENEIATRVDWLSAVRTSSARCVGYAPWDERPERGRFFVRLTAAALATRALSCCASDSLQICHTHHPHACTSAGSGATER